MSKNTDWDSKKFRTSEQERLEKEMKILLEELSQQKFVGRRDLAHFLRTKSASLGMSVERDLVSDFFDDFQEQVESSTLPIAQPCR